MLKALKAATRLEIRNFKAFGRWLKRFPEACDFFKCTNGESTAIDTETINKWLNKLSPSMQDYAPGDIFNADEAGLFYHILQDKTKKLKNENPQDEKVSKKRLAMLLC